MVFRLADSLHPESTLRKEFMGPFAVLGHCPAISPFALTHVLWTRTLGAWATFAFPPGDGVGRLLVLRMENAASAAFGPEWEETRDDL